jgi:hypothetical protein
MSKAKKRKRARDAGPDENAIPGSHGPPQQKAAILMRAIIETCAEAFPGHQVTVFVAEPPEDAVREGRLPRFNYASTAHRADMVAVLKAFIARQEEEGPALDKIHGFPPTSAKQ